MNNRYCERLGIGTPPCVDDYTDRRDALGRPLTLASRMILALLEAGEPQHDLDLAVRLLAAGVDSPCGDMLTSIRKAWHGMPPIVRDPDGRLALDLSWCDWDLRLRILGLREHEARDAARFAGLRRALVRAVPEPDAPSAIAILDLQDRTFRTLFGADMARLGGILAGYDVVAALRPRATLFALGLDPDARHLVDLSPPQKSRTINRQGRKLAISPELLITSSTGISDPLGDPARIARYLADGDRPRLARRLESDLKSLAAFWRYASLHRAVRLRWGFLDEWIGTDWALPGEPSLYDILKDAQATGAEVEVVCGTAPGWTDPWARALRGRVVRVEMWVFEIETRDGVGVIDRGEVQAVRGVG